MESSLRVLPLSISAARAAYSGRNNTNDVSTQQNCFWNKNKPALGQIEWLRSRISCSRSVNWCSPHNDRNAKAITRVCLFIYTHESSENNQADYIFALASSFKQRQIIDYSDEWLEEVEGNYYNWFVVERRTSSSVREGERCYGKRRGVKSDI